MKLPKFNQKGITHILAPVLFIAIFAVVGGFVLLKSHAAPANKGGGGGGGKKSTSTTIYGYKDVSSFYVNNVLAQPTSDYLAEDGASMGSISVADLKAGDVLTWGGAGAVINGPTLLSTQYCFTMRDVSTTTTSTLAVGSNNIVVKPAPISGLASPTASQEFWQYNCVPDASPIKLVSGEVHLYQVDILETLAY